MFRVRVALLIGALLGVAGCGGPDSDSGGITPPITPPTPTVATVEVAPATVTLFAPATAQLTAVAKGASGATLSRTVAWTSSSPAVATISGSGVVTGVSGGTATITAAVDGKSGSALITVIASVDGPVIARAEVGVAGGTLGTADVAVTIPAGALASSSTIQLVRDTMHEPELKEGVASANYLIDGLPADRIVPLRVRLRMTTAASGLSGIAVTRPSIAFSDSGDVLTLGTSLIAAQDSAGYLVATVPLRGRPASWLPALASLPGSGFGAVVSRESHPRALASAVNPAELKAAAELTGMIGLTRALSAKGNFEVWAIGAVPDAAT
jgi:hypothetical protein